MELSEEKLFLGSDGCIVHEKLFYDIQKINDFSKNSCDAESDVN